MTITRHLTRAAVMLLLALLSTTSWAQLVQDADGYYLIGTNAEWTEFANGINDGTIAINANARLTAENITVTTMIGNNGHRYAGTFDGNNKTITLSISGTSGFEAPFSYINGATIKDLTVSGTLSGGIHCSGLIGVTTGTNNVNNVIVNCTITATSSHCSGILGRNDNATTTLNGCAFTGSISKASGNCNVGVLWGWSNGGNAIITNCLENGTYTNCSPLQPIGNLPTNTVTNTFYLSNVSSTCGTRVYTTTQDGEVNGQVVAVDGNNYYAIAEVSGINERYELLEASVTPEPIVSFLGVTLTKDTDYTVSYSNNTSGGTGSVIITGINDYLGTKTVNFAIAANTLSGNGTEESPYIIGSDADWEAFAASVNSGFTYSGRFVKLDANNINASITIGLRNNEPFSGTFDGNDHTLMVTLTSNAASTSGNTEGVAPFHFIKNATIKNLHTAGSITVSTNHASGLVGFAEGTNLIKDCTVSATINTSYYAGGFIGHGYSSFTTIRDCVFEGTINGGNNPIAGFCGWNHQTVTIINCLEKGAYTNCTNFNPIFFGLGTASVSGTYYLNAKNNGGDLGTKVYTTLPNGEMCGQVTAVDNNNYYVVTTVSGINERYQLMGESVTPVPVVKFFNTILTQGTDYTVSYSNNTSGGTGSVIITGINDYSGTKTVNFEIAANTLSGSGTEGNPYIINSDEDWTSFANSVNSGFTYSGMFLKLTNNVNATVNIGLRNNEPFSGTFDGDGHTLTVTLTANAASTSGNTEGIAPFHFIKNATIKNLRTVGTITSTTNHTSGLVGFSEGTNAIQNCVVSTTLNVRNYAGGIVGHSLVSRVTIDDCLFDGVINGSSSSYIAGIWGWNNGGSGTIANCLENGTYTGVSSYDAIGWTPATPTNTYRINSSSKGIATTAEALADGTITYKLQAGRTEMVWGQRIGIDTVPVLTNDESYRVYRSINGGYTNDPTQAYEGLQQDADGNYLIGCVWDWKDFASLVQTTPTANAKMTADIDLGDDQTTIGSGNTNAENANVVFKGVFDGNGHTLTIHYNTSEGFYAPFRHISGATIKNLHVTGSIISSGGRVGGIVCGVFGGSSIQNKIEKCRSSVILTSNCQVSNNNAESVGGIVGQVGFKSNLSLEDCIFDGEITGHVSNVIWSGLVGVLDGTLNTTRCLQAGSFNDLDNGTTSNSATIVCRWQGTGTLTMDATYYINPFKTIQGTQATTEQLSDGTITAVLQNGREEEIWVQDPVTNQPMLALFANTISFNGDGSEDNPFIITTTAELDYLASMVNSGENYDGMYFKLGADIAYDPNVLTIDNNGDGFNDSNYIPIGTGVFYYYNTPILCSFRGIFDGDGHTISGIRIYREGNTSDDCYQGVFGFIQDFGPGDSFYAGIYNLWVADVDITGWINIGGIVGENFSSIIENCHVASNVVIRANNQDDVRRLGGIVGYNETNGTVTRCSSAVTIIPSNNNSYYDFGGLAGYNEGTLTNNLVIGATIPAVNHPDHNNFYGAIAGSRKLNYSSLQHNYYSACTVGGVPNATNVGCGPLISENNGVCSDLYDNNGAVPGYLHNVTGYGNSTESDHWALIASPITTVGGIAPTAVGNLIADPATDYDLYRFNQSASKEWENYKNPTHTAGFVLENGKGYLYANKKNVTLAFAGTINTANEMPVALTYENGVEFAGYNLVGNPFTEEASIDMSYYKMNAAGDDLEAETSSVAIPAFTGVIVQATTSGQHVTFTKCGGAKSGAKSEKQGSLQLMLSKDGTVHDKAIVSFDEGTLLGKYFFNETHAKLYIPQGSEDYAIAFSEKTGEMPLNFKATKSGEYTLSFNTEGVKLAYLHLIDNLTGADVNLLQTPSYIFEGKANDYASRFRLVFSTGNAAEDSFAFFNGSNWVINNEGRATLQVIDIMGRVISTETINGDANVNVNEAADVYMLRLINGDNVKVQKVVVR